MKYVLTEAEKRRQKNLFLQMWRFVVLSIKFMKLTRMDYSRLHSVKNPSGPKSA
jgi:hypothetical protein